MTTVDVVDGERETLASSRADGRPGQDAHLELASPLATADDYMRTTGGNTSPDRGANLCTKGPSIITSCGLPLVACLSTRARCAARQSGPCSAAKYGEVVLCLYTGKIVEGSRHRFGSARYIAY